MDFFLFQLFKEQDITTAELVVDTARPPARRVSPLPQVTDRRRKCSRWASSRTLNKTVTKSDCAPVKRSSCFRLRNGSRITDDEPLIQNDYSEASAKSPARRDLSNWHSFDSDQPSCLSEAPPNLPTRIVSPRKTQRPAAQRPCQSALHAVEMSPYCNREQC